MQKDSIIYVAGGSGMVGSAIIRKLHSEGFHNVISTTSSQLDLRNQSDTSIFFKRIKPEYVFLAAAHVGGIHANNTYKADFIYDNLSIQTNVIHCCHTNIVKKLLFLGSSCIYPKHAEQPIREEYLLSGKLEPTNEPYAIAKIAGIKMCQAYHDQYHDDFISVMPPNLYGPNDNYSLLTSHVIPALIKKIHKAKVLNGDVYVWGTGNAMREFMHVDDLADACFFLMQNETRQRLINAGTGDEISIKSLAFLIAEIIGYKGRIYFDESKPDGTPRKIMDSSVINEMGWVSKISLKDGLEMTYKNFLKNVLPGL